ncbi:NUDIX domain-containing protein [Streptomyces sp. NPDC048172]|uniref:NUDIX domain-containing protein n=1 Tax=Streptomyces sp. NPDC048172 TaxID=3365505 RepID=UPI00371F84F7
MPPRLTALGAHLVFERDGHLLLGRRGPGVSFAPDSWHLPAGQVEDETVRACAVREAYEGLGVTLREADLQLVHTVDGVSHIQLFFRVHHWKGEPRLREPHLCAGWTWWRRTALPEPLVGHARTALEAIGQGWPYTSVGRAA